MFDRMDDMGRGRRSPRSPVQDVLRRIRSEAETVPLVSAEDLQAAHALVAARAERRNPPAIERPAAEPETRPDASGDETERAPELVHAPPAEPEADAALAPEPETPENRLMAQKLLEFQIEKGEGRSAEEAYESVRAGLPPEEEARLHAILTESGAFGGVPAAEDDASERHAAEVAELRGQLEASEARHDELTRAHEELASRNAGLERFATEQEQELIDQETRHNQDLTRLAAENAELRRQNRELSQRFDAVLRSLPKEVFGGPSLPSPAETPLEDPRLAAALETRRTRIAERTSSLGEGATRLTENVLSWYRQRPIWQRACIGAALAGGAMAGGVLATGAFVGLAAWRAIGTASASAGVYELVRGKLERSRAEGKNKLWHRNPKVFAAAAAALIGVTVATSSMWGHALTEHLGGILGGTDHVPDALPPADGPAPYVPSPDTVPGATPPHEWVVAHGDVADTKGLWGVAESLFKQDSFLSSSWAAAHLDPELQQSFIQAMHETLYQHQDALHSLSPDSIGIEKAGGAFQSIVRPGDHLSLERLFADPEFAAHLQETLASRSYKSLGAALAHAGGAGAFVEHLKSAAGATL